MVCLLICLPPPPPCVVANRRCVVSFTHDVCLRVKLLSMCLCNPFMRKWRDLGKFIMITRRNVKLLLKSFLLFFNWCLFLQSHHSTARQFHILNCSPSKKNDHDHIMHTVFTSIVNNHNYRELPQNFKRKYFRQLSKWIRCSCNVRVESGLNK